jgi:hypothetical protein
MLSTHFDTQITSARRGGTATRSHRPSQRTHHRDGIATRLRVGLHQRRLDRELANGLPVDGSPQHELRAAQVSGVDSRVGLAP